MDFEILNKDIEEIRLDALAVPVLDNQESRNLLGYLSKLYEIDLNEIIEKIPEFYSKERTK